MSPMRPAPICALVLGLAVLSGCGMIRGGGGGGGNAAAPEPEVAAVEEERSTIWDLFAPRPEVGQVGSVNRYLWNASLEVLNFLPVETIDPFSGVLVTGYGTPPGGGRAYKATVLISDPALDARSLNLALITRNGPAARETVLAVEDAILTRARQLRAQDSRF